jgi:hypothetical protein
VEAGWRAQADADGVVWVAGTGRGDGDGGGAEEGVVLAFGGIVVAGHPPLWTGPDQRAGLGDSSFYSIFFFAVCLGVRRF